MKVTSSIVSALAFSVSVGCAAASTLRSTSGTTRSLQNNQYEQQQYNNQWYYQNQQWGNNQQGGQQQNGGNYMDADGQMYEDFEEYMRAEMAAKTFSFTGCSTIDSGYGKQSFVTYRLCGSCSGRKSDGCDNSNGDYVVNMQEFAETYREYHEQVTGQEGSPFECVRAEEYGNNRKLQNYYNNGQQQQNAEFFIGPLCSGGSKVELGVFYNEWCTMPAEGVSVKSVLGFTPDSSSLSVEQCISCTSSYNNNNGNGEAELNPLCERMLERSGRCDRTDQSSEFDKFWEDVVSFVNAGGSTNFNQGDEYYEEEGDYYQDQYEAEQYEYQQQNQYNNGNRALYNMNYNSYANQNTCDFIDSLAHSAGAWDRLKNRASAQGMSTGALIIAICAAVVATAVVSIMLLGWVSQRGAEAVGRRGSESDESETPYHKAEETTPEVTIT